MQWQARERELKRKAKAEEKRIKKQARRDAKRREKSQDTNLYLDEVEARRQ